MSAQRSEPCVLDATVQSVADDLLDILVDGSLEPSIIRMTDADAGISFGLKPLGGEHPSTVLAGFDAPPDWHAIGVAVEGRVYHLDDRADPDRPTSRTSLVLICTRSGEIGQAIHVDGREAPPATERPQGPQIDILLRCLGLPTDPPAGGTGGLLTAWWLGSILDDDAAELHTWAAVAAKHPAMILLGHDGLDIGPNQRALVEADLVTAARLLGRTLTWEKLRLQVADGIPLADCPAWLAGWFDTGAFARHVEGGLLPLHFLLDAIDGHLPTPLACEVRRVVAETAAVESMWPDAI